MRFSLKGTLLLLALLFAGAFVICYQAAAQSSSGTIQGVVKDPSGAVVAGAKVEISNSVSGFRRDTITGSSGDFRFANVPFNPYHMVITAKSFAPFTQDVDVRAAVPLVLDISLTMGTASTTIEVRADAKGLIEIEPNYHTDLDRNLFDKLPLESQSSSVSSLVTLASPNAVADSNGLVHGIGDHAENSFSVDGQPMTDQTSKVFSNQIPVDSIQSLEVISGAPPAEYGDKTSLVIKVTTRSGLGQTQPAGSVTTSYGTFGSTNIGGNIPICRPKTGKFFFFLALNPSRLFVSL